MTIMRSGYPGIIAKTLRARAEAFESAAGHLKLYWSDDPDEIAEGLKLSTLWHSEAVELRARANHIETIAGLYLPKTATEP